MEQYPIYYGVAPNNKVDNWRPLVHWIMVIPHLIVLYILGLVGAVVTVVSWFTILFTGRLPDGLAGVQTMVMRYQARTMGFYLGLTTVYPPFEFDTTVDDPGTYPIRVDTRPEYENRNRLTVFFRIFMMIPLLIVMYIYFIIAGIVAVIAWFAVLFTGTYPEGLRNITVGMGRYLIRISGYGNLLTDQYPPFSLTQ